MFNEQSLLHEGDISISNSMQYHSSSKAGCSEDGTKSTYSSQLFSSINFLLTMTGVMLVL